MRHFFRQAFRVDQLEAVVHKAETDAVKAANQLNQVTIPTT